MKPSIYNNRIRLSEKSDIIYNALSNRSIAVKHDFMLSPMELLSETQQEMFRTNGMIVDDDVDEYALLREKWVAAARSDTFQLIINPTLQCNFRCWYCYENHEGHTSMDDDTFQRVLRAIDRLIDSHANVSIGFFGGEPLLRYDNIVKPIIEHSTEYARQLNKEVTFSFTTNGYLLGEEQAEFFKNHNVQSFQITLDGGKEFHDKVRHSGKRGSYDKIIKNIEILLSRHLPVLLRLNVTKDNIASFGKVVEWLGPLPANLKSKLTVGVHQVWQTIGNEDIAKESDRLIDSIIQAGVYARGIPGDNLRDMCYGDRINSAVINYNGEIYSCTAVDFKSETPTGHIDPTGCMAVDEDFTARRINRRWEKDICRECRIMPLCLGGCSRKVMSNDIGYCLYDGDENEKDKVVLDIIKSRVRVMEYNKIIDTFAKV